MLVESRMRGNVHVRFGGRKRGDGAGGVTWSPRPLPTRHVPLSPSGAELLFEIFSQRYERGSIVVTSNLPFDEWTRVFASERLTGALLDRLTHHVHILEMNGDSYRLKQSKHRITHDQPLSPSS